MKNIRDELIRHYGSDNIYADSLYDTIYVMDTIKDILSSRSNNTRNSYNNSKYSSDYMKNDSCNNNNFIDVDVVEIGTSNFNTIIGLIDKDDHISGDIITE